MTINDRDIFVRRDRVRLRNRQIIDPCNGDSDCQILFAAAARDRHIDNRSGKVDRQNLASAKANLISLIVRHNQGKIGFRIKIEPNAKNVIQGQINRLAVNVRAEPTEFERDRTIFRVSDEVRQRDQEVVVILGEFKWVGLRCDYRTIVYPNNRDCRRGCLGAAQPRPTRYK